MPQLPYAPPTPEAVITGPWQPREMSLFLQPTSIAEGRLAQELPRWLQEVRSWHRNPLRRGFVRDLVIQYVADESKHLCTDVLDSIMPYLPGGAESAFSEVYAGTLPPGADIMDERAQQQYIIDSEQVARKFSERYPKLRFHWYISVEEFLPKFSDVRIMKLHADLQLRLIERLKYINNDTTTLWSPATGVRLDHLARGEQKELERNISLFFALINDGIGGHYQVDLQDTLSRPCLTGSPDAGVAQEVDWVRMLQRVAPQVHIRVNAELFATAECPNAGNPDTVLSRLASYERLGVALGACFEIRHWNAAIHSRPVHSTESNEINAPSNTYPSLTNIFKFERLSALPEAESVSTINPSYTVKGLPIINGP
ncbi:hypothetical protein ACFWIB_42655 [Streptomyces sp. NPDC127051]|uniref:hypothetical protein n=1 Tax=Streptomyces sp. NPDC127051 TaxID=3347119 RepID=UPI003649D90C